MIEVAHTPAADGAVVRTTEVARRESDRRSRQHQALPVHLPHRKQHSQ